jgi:hypothetical protein
MTLNALGLHLVKYFNSQKDGLSIGKVKSRMAGYQGISTEEILEIIKSKGYVSIQDNQIKITDEGIDLVQNLEKTELQRIRSLVFDDFDLALIAFLFNRNDFVKIEDFPEILRECAPKQTNSTSSGNLRLSLFRLNAYISEKYGWYVINDIGKAYYENKIRRQHESEKGQETLAEENFKACIDLEIPTLTASERIWLTELYFFVKKGERFTYRDLWSRLVEKLPNNFKPAAVDEKLMSSDGEKIHVLGVVAVEGNFDIINKINKIICSIRGIILRDKTIENIAIDQIATVCELPVNDVSFSLELASFYISLYNGSSYKENSTELISIKVSGSEAIFYNYLHFEGIEFYIKDSQTKNKFNSEEIFSQKEIISFNAKLDLLTGLMENVMLSQQFTYDDVMEEINEMKTLYSLKKKNWKRLLVSKLTELTAGGVISSVISDPLSDIIKPEINKLLSH